MITVLFKQNEHVNIEEIDVVLLPLDNNDDKTNYLKLFVVTTKVLFDSRDENLILTRHT